MTWKKFLPDYNIILLDYEILPKYLDSNILSKIICKNLPLPVQADAIRVAILQKYGGIWMDIDIIITKNISNILNSLKGIDLAMIDNEINKKYLKCLVHIGFIYSTKYSIFLKKWLKGIIKNIKFFKHILYKSNKYNIKSTLKEWDYNNKWYYLGNGIIDPLLKNRPKIDKDFLLINHSTINCFPEYSLKIKIRNATYLYKKFYFSKGNGNAKIIINSSKGLILLHNTWTPKKYKLMSETKFLKQNIMLSHLLKLLLKNPYKN